MIRAFGPRAERYAAAVPQLDAIVTEPEWIDAAYQAAIEWREAGRSFYGMVLFDEPRTRTIEIVAPSLFGHIADFDQRLGYCDQVGRGEAIVNGQPVAAFFSEIAPHVRDATCEFFLLVNGVLVRSHTEYARLEPFFTRPRPFERVVAVPRLPPVERQPARSPAVVVWMPHRPAEAAALYAFGLCEFHGDVTLVVGDGPAPASVPGTFVHRDDPAVVAALAKATAVIATDAADPGDAIAFAQRGYGVASPLTSGAHEYVAGVAAYDPGRVRTLHVAAARAMGAPATARALPEPPPANPSIPGLAAIPADAPLVSIIVATYNRPADLAACLSCIGAQTYPAVEAVVVNDAGQPVDDVVAAFPFARLITLESNVGTMRAFNRGLEAARGEFVQFLPDDDWIYPDHVTRLAAALLTSGASIAHSNGVIRHQRRGADGVLATVGYNAGVFLDTTTPTEALVATPIVLISVLFRRSVFDVIEPMRNIILADHEIQLRATEHFTFAYVDQATVEWRLRGESYHRGMDSPAGMREVYDQMHPRPQRPLIERARAAAIQNVAGREPGPYMFPPTIRLEPSN